MTRGLREYQPVWNKIKETAKCRLEVPPQLVARVKKAVIKEKNMDSAFKLMNDEDQFRLVISYDRKSQVLKFELKQKYGLEERVVV